MAQAAVTEELAMKRRKNSPKSTFFVKKLKFNFFYISSSYAKILGGKLSRTWEFARSRSKAKNGERKNRERAKVGDNNGQATHGARKHAWRTQAAWAKIVYFLYSLKYENPRKYTVWIILYVYNVKNRHYSHRKFGHVIAHLQEATRKKTPWGWGLWVGEGR